MSEESAHVYKALSEARAMAAQFGIAWHQKGAGNTKGKLGNDVKSLVAAILPQCQLEIIPSEVKIVSSERVTTSSGGQMLYVTLTQDFIVASTLDGSIITGGSAGLGADMGDKAVQKALSYCWKSFILNLLSIPEAPIEAPDDSAVTKDEADILLQEVKARQIDLDKFYPYLLERYGAKGFTDIKPSDYPSVLAAVKSKPLK